MNRFTKIITVNAPKFPGPKPLQRRSASNRKRAKIRKSTKMEQATIYKFPVVDMEIGFVERFTFFTSKP